MDPPRSPYAAKFPKAVAKIVDDAEGPLAFSAFPAESGKAERQENEYVRHGIVNLVAALDVHGGGIFRANTIEANNSTNFCSLLEEVGARVPEGLQIHVVMDNGSSSNEEPSARPRRWWPGSWPSSMSTTEQPDPSGGPTTGAPSEAT